jgi:hypothetical protein
MIDFTIVDANREPDLYAALDDIEVVDDAFFGFTANDTVFDRPEYVLAISLSSTCLIVILAVFLYRRFKLRKRSDANIDSNQLLLAQGHPQLSDAIAPVLGASIAIGKGQAPSVPIVLDFPEAKTVPVASAEQAAPEQSEEDLQNMRWYISEADAERGEPNSPIFGVDKSPLLDAEKALLLAKDKHEGLRDSDFEVLPAVWLAKRKTEAAIAGTDITADEAIAVHVYTQDGPFYKVLNKALRGEQREQLKPFFSYLRLLRQAFRKLPHIQGNVFRGVKDVDFSHLRKGSELVWWQVTSCTTNPEVLNAGSFLGQKSVKRTMFHIVLTKPLAVDVGRLSALPHESEVILPPGSAFVVSSVVKSPGPGLEVIFLEEAVGAPQLIS